MRENCYPRGKKAELNAMRGKGQAATGISKCSNWPILLLLVLSLNFVSLLSSPVLCLCGSGMPSPVLKKCEKERSAG